MNKPEITRLKEKTGIEILWIYILTLLKKQKSHAYILRKKIEKEYGFKPGNITAYTVLYKLESRGYVKSQYEKNKKIYTITNQGKKILTEATRILKKRIKKIEE